MFADAHEFPKSAQDVAAVVRGGRNVGTGLVQEFLFIVAAASSRALLIQNYIGIMDLPVPPSDSSGFDGTWLVLLQTCARLRTFRQTVPEAFCASYGFRFVNGHPVASADSLLSKLHEAL